jgi:hypothetical protein
MKNWIFFVMAVSLMMVMPGCNDDDEGYSLNDYWVYDGHH